MPALHTSRIRMDGGEPARRVAGGEYRSTETNSAVASPALPRSATQSWNRKKRTTQLAETRRPCDAPSDPESVPARGGQKTDCRPPRVAVRCPSVGGAAVQPWPNVAHEACRQTFGWTEAALRFSGMEGWRVPSPLGHPRPRRRKVDNHGRMEVLRHHSP